MVTLPVGVKRRVKSVFLEVLDSSSFFNEIPQAWSGSSTTGGGLESRGGGGVWVGGRVVGGVAGPGGWVGGGAWEGGGGGVVRR